MIIYFQKPFHFNIINFNFFHPFELKFKKTIHHMLDVHIKTTYVVDACVFNNIPNFVKIKNQL
jgi:hypothetical protein